MQYLIMLYFPFPYQFNRLNKVIMKGGRRTKETLVGCYKSPFAFLIKKKHLSISYQGWYLHVNKILLGTRNIEKMQTVP